MPRPPSAPRGPRSRPLVRRAGQALAPLILLLLTGADPLHAQLRPLEPLAWQIFDPPTTLVAQLGVGVLHDQRASLAGTSGTLRELGNVSAIWRSGRIAIEAAGTVRRSFEDTHRYGDPHPTVQETGPRRSDSGDYSVGTIVRLTPDDRPALLALRFGTRLPNSDDAVGIDRDRTDFYALLGGRFRRGPLHLGGEAGLGIFGTHDLDYEQADPLLYTLTGDLSTRPVSLHAAFLGHRAGFGGWVQRGSESRSELRVGGGFGERLRLQVLYVHGLAEHSPSGGWLLSVRTHR
jgi:hypothetical protein